MIPDSPNEIPKSQGIPTFDALEQFQFHTSIALETVL